jgi:uncharacterized protein YjbI with pentapeptide repeats
MDKRNNQNPKKSLDKHVGESLKQGREWTKDNKTLTFLFITSAIIGIVVIFTRSEVSWIGFGKDSNKSTTVEEVINPRDGKIIKLRKETDNEQSFKTLWDWLQLGGVLAIPLALYYFERSEQRRAEKRNQLEQEQADKKAKLERDEAATIQREDALENYINQISQLLVDTKLITKIQDFIKKIISINKDKNEEIKELIINNSNPIGQIKINRRIYSQIIEQLNTDPEIFVVLDIIRARTLSILRKLDKDGERKGEIIRFLIDVELIDKVDLNSANLTDADLSNADLSNANLSGANLLCANLLCANLLCADLFNADLSNANLSGANLTNTNLIAANLSGANLKWTYFSSANLDSANLDGAIKVSASLDGANLRSANLIAANLIAANLIAANLIAANLRSANLNNIIWDEGTDWNNAQGLDLARNVPEALLNQLNLTAQPSPSKDTSPSA